VSLFIKLLIWLLGLVRAGSLIYAKLHSEPATETKVAA